MWVQQQPGPGNTYGRTLPEGFVMGYRLSRVLVAALAVSVAIVGLAPAPAEARRQSAVVMTRNVYLGADLTAAIGATDLDALYRAAADSFYNVNQTDFPQRAGLLAQEIADTAPDLVGLQEVALWRTGPLNGPVTPALEVAFDFLALLEDEMAALGLDYTAAVVQENFDVEIPATATTNGDLILRDVRLTMHNVILVKDGIDYSNPQAGHFETNATYPTIVGELVDLRGWIAVDVSMGKRPFRFVNTHLEPYITPVRNIQAQEMVNGPFATNLKLVAVGDFNTPPTGEESEAYVILTDRSGGKLIDAWPRVSDEPGYTCCQAADLTNLESSAATRIDLILTRTKAVKVISAEIVGMDARTADGLWASDHFGVVAELTIP
jgi:endonuclease/exonuclease/phosphatase family metal-dependent hydrolase